MYSQKTPAAGYDADSRTLPQDTVKQVREEMGQCNEDCLAQRRKDESTYPSHGYKQNGFRVLMHGVLGRFLLCRPACFRARACTR